MANEKQKETKEQKVAREAKEKEAAKVKAKALRTAKKEAADRVRVYAKDPDADIGKDLKADLILLVGEKAKSLSTGKASSNKALRDFFLEKNEISEMEVFKKFHIGRPEMGIKICIFLKGSEPKDRIWVKLFEDKEVYKLVGKGPKPPKGWNGYLPVDLQEL